MRRRIRTQRQRILALSLVVFAVSTPESLAADTPSRIAPTLTDSAVLARAFAPTFVFHERETLFPTNPMPPVGANTEPEAWRARVARYGGLELSEKLRQASVGYRVFSRLEGGQNEVVVEYWCYYVFNAFTVRGGWLPFRVSDDHPHDLERLYIVLTPASGSETMPSVTDEAEARAAFRITSVVANAHDGSIPPNRYNADSEELLAAPIAVLVERGSHAMAPDVNQDGRFTPGIDSTAISKVQWGIRDTGSTWGRYRASFMDDRGQSAIRLCGPATIDEDSGCPQYDLHPATELQHWFSGLQLSAGDRRDVLGTTPWLLRTFGDVRIEELLVPADPPDGRMLTRMLNRRTKTEEGFVAGFTTDAHAPALIVGRRYFWDIPSHHIPDVAVEAVMLAPKGKRPSIEATIWSSYNVDAITNVLLGVGWFSRGGGADVAAGTDLRVGRFRVRPTWRLRERAYNIRVTMAF